jgi:hypothetical protein
MGNLAVNPAQVQPVGGGAIMNGHMAAGVAGDAGETVYLDGASNKWKLGTADNDTNAAIHGVLEASAAGGQPCVVQHEGDIDLGADAGVVEGVTYGFSPTDGKICAVNDALMVAGKFVTVLGVGKANNVMGVKVYATDSQVQ